MRVAEVYPALGARGGGVVRVPSWLPAVPAVRLATDERLREAVIGSAVAAAQRCGDSTLGELFPGLGDMAVLPLGRMAPRVGNVLIRENLDAPERLAATSVVELADLRMVASYTLARLVRWAAEVAWEQQVYGRAVAEARTAHEALRCVARIAARPWPRLFADTIGQVWHPLGPLDQTLFVRAILPGDGSPHRQLAAEMNRSVTLVGQRLRRVKARLERWMDEDRFRCAAAAAEVIRGVVGPAVPAQHAAAQTRTVLPGMDADFIWPALYCAGYRRDRAGTELRTELPPPRARFHDPRTRQPF